MLQTLGGSGGGKVPGSPPSHSGLALFSLASSLAALISSSSSAACSVQYSRPSHRLPPSSTWGSCRIQVRPLPLAVFRVRLSPIELGSRSNISPAEASYSEQLFQFLQDCAQKEGIFGEFQAPFQTP